MRFDRLAIHALAFMALSHVPFSSESSSKNWLATAQEEEAVPVEDVFAPPENSESFAFQAEVSRMLDIVVNSLYQNKDVFLRELISNASDALDKVRFMSLTNPDYSLGDEEKLQVQIEYDPDLKTLTVRDTGIGMTHDEMVENLGTVARSGTTKFLQLLQDSDNPGDVSQIGQFGVGFYSTFLVADRVQVASKHPTSDTQNVWVSTNGESEFHIYPDPRGNTLSRGTEITLFLKEDCTEYADPMRLKDLAKHYSEFVMHPIEIRNIETKEVEVEDDEEEKKEDGEEEEEKKEGDEDELEVEDNDEEEEEEKPKKLETITTYDWELINGNPAIWTRPKEDITDEEYQSFWKVVSKDANGDAETWVHFNAEGNINFKSLLYLPRLIPDEIKYGNLDSTGGISLYVRKVLISDSFELLPRYLSFIRGVVDSDDLPLNVNRETLQESKIIQVIKKKLVRKVLDMIRQYSKEADAEFEKEDDGDEEETKDAESEKEDEEEKTNKYIEWYKNFSPSLKMGAIEDEPNRGKLMKLLRFQTSKSDGDWISLEKYVENMKEWQDEVFVLAGVSLESVEKSQFLDVFKEKDVEVIYLTEPIDEYMIGHVRDFDGKKFKDISSEDVKLKDEDSDLATRRDKYYKKKFKPLTKWLKKLYGPSVMRVVLSKRLGSAPAIASSSQYGHSANMERIMRAQAFQAGQDDFMMKAMKIFELNPRHPIVLKLLEGCPPEEEAGEGEEPFKVSPDVEDAAWILHEMALLNGGFPLTDPVAHSHRMTRFLQSTLGLESLQLEPEVDPPEEEEEAPELDADALGGLNMEDLDLDALNLDMGDEL